MEYTKNFIKTCRVIISSMKPLKHKYMMCKNVRKKIQSRTAASFTFKSQNYLETCGMSSSEHI